MKFCLVMHNNIPVATAAWVNEREGSSYITYRRIHSHEFWLQSATQDYQVIVIVIRLIPSSCELGDWSEWSETLRPTRFSYSFRSSAELSKNRTVRRRILRENPIVIADPSRTFRARIYSYRYLDEGFPGMLTFRKHLFTRTATNPAHVEKRRHYIPELRSCRRNHRVVTHMYFIARLDTFALDRRSLAIGRGKEATVK